MPEMSVLVLTPDSYATVRRVMDHLRAQTARARLEILLIAPSAEGLQVPAGALEGFQSARIIEVGPLRSTALARAIGVREARAPVVALVEDHCFPEPSWADALIDAHRGPWAAVGPVMCNANPGSRLSWANLLIEYGFWTAPAPAGPAEHLPGHNSAYKRAVLLLYGPALEAQLEAESVMHWDLRARGHQLYLEPRARTHHLNFSRLGPSARLRLTCGRFFAGARSRTWSPLRRLLYAAGSPLIPLVRLRRTMAHVRRTRRGQRLPSGLLPVIALGLILEGVGEFLGYALGGGDTMRTISDWDFHRPRFMTDRDRRAAAV